MHRHSTLSLAALAAFAVFHLGPRSWAQSPDIGPNTRPVIKLPGFPSNPLERCGRYSVKKLPGPNGLALDCRGYALNDHKMVVGAADSSTAAPLPVYWNYGSNRQYGSYSELDLPPTSNPPPKGVAFDVNNDGIIVGWVDTGGPFAARWRPTHGYAAEVVANMRYEISGINQAGWLCSRGTAQGRIGSPDDTPNITELLGAGTCAPNPETWGANAINEQLDVVGFTKVCSVPPKNVAAWWPQVTPGTMPQAVGLGSGPNYTDSYARDINNGRVVVGFGYAVSDGDPRPLMWPTGPGSLVELTDASGQPIAGGAAAINDRGSIVGTVQVNGRDYAVIWERCRSQGLRMHFLENRVILPDQVKLLEAIDINTHGDILVHAESPAGEFPLVLRRR